MSAEILYVDGGNDWYHMVGFMEQLTCVCSWSKMIIYITRAVNMCLLKYHMWMVEKDGYHNGCF